MKKMLIILILTFGFSSCNNSNKSYDMAQNEIIINSTHPGKKLMEMYCYACHNPTTEHDKRLAPPMIAIKKHYIDNNTTKKEFTKNLQSWIKNPNEADAKMFGAVRRFGIMTKVEYPEADIELIADYMYDNVIEQSQWFEEHHNEQKGKQKRKQERKGKGQKNN